MLLSLGLVKIEVGYLLGKINGPKIYEERTCVRTCIIVPRSTLQLRLNVSKTGLGEERLYRVKEDYRLD